MSGTAAWLRRMALGMLLAVLLLAGLTARLVTEGEAELHQSDLAFDRGDLRNFARTVLNQLFQDRLNRRILTLVHSFVSMVVLQLHEIPEWATPARASPGRGS